MTAYSPSGPDYSPAGLALLRVIFRGDTSAMRINKQYGVFFEPAQLEFKLVKILSHAGIQTWIV